MGRRDSWTEDRDALTEFQHVCERCGTRMTEIHCKIVCPNCGYTRDCSDP